MSFRRTCSLTQPNSQRNVLGVECLDDRVMPSASAMFGEISSSVSVAVTCEAQLSHIDGVRRINIAIATNPLSVEETTDSLDALAVFQENLPPMPLADRIDSFGSKPGATGEG